MEVFAIKKVDADSWNAGPPFLMSLHATEECARDFIPDNVKSLERPVKQYKHQNYRPVADFAYFTIDAYTVID